MILYYLECYMGTQVVERSHLHADLEFCVKLAEEKMKAGFEWVQIERNFFDADEIKSI